MASSLDTLISLAHPEGGWGYKDLQPAHLEPTCLALLAFRAEAELHANTVNDARAFVGRCRRPDGSYRLNRGREAAVWGTALALFTESAYCGGDSPSTDEL